MLGDGKIRIAPLVIGIGLHLSKPNTEARMVIKAVIFDMDGLLIDSEPLWQEAAHEVLHPFSVKLSLKEYETTTGLRTKEFIDHWFRHFNLPQHLAAISRYRYY